MRTWTSLFVTWSILGLWAFVAPSLQAGFEIAYVAEAPENNWQGYTKVYIDSGDNPIDAEEWEAFVPPPGYFKNTPRNAEFNAENTFTSPGLPYVQIDAIGTDPEGEGYTWMFVAQTQSAMWPYNHELFPGTTNAYEAAALVTTPPPGAIKFSSNEKNQEMIFWARENNAPDGAPILRYFITDEWGNRYIMGATGSATDEGTYEAFWDSVLPNENWVKSEGFLEETLNLFPAYSSDGQAHYNLFRDSADNTFFQIEWGGSGNGIAAQIEDMPLWAGATNDTILGRAGDDNLIHGAQGNDTIFAQGNNDSIYGDDGVDTVVLQGIFSDYSVVSWTEGGVELGLSGFGSTKYFYDVEYLQFDNGTIATSAVPEPAAALLGVIAVILGAVFRRRTNPAAAS